GGELWKVVARRGLRTSLRNWMVIIVFVITFIIFGFMAAFLYVMTKAGAAFSKDLGADPSQMMLQIARADQFLGELVALIIGSSVLTDDFRTGAFPFYFSRPITRGAYLLGKLVPVACVVGLVALAPTVLLRLEVFAIKGEARELIPVTRAITQGLVATVALCAPAALISALVRRRILGMGAYFGLFSGTYIIAEVLNSALGARWPHHISIGKNIEIVTQWLYGQPTEASPLVAAVLLLAISAGSLALAYRRLRRVDILE